MGVRTALEWRPYRGKMGIMNSLMTDSERSSSEESLEEARARTEAGNAEAQTHLTCDVMWVYLSGVKRVVSQVDRPVTGGMRCADDFSASSVC